MARFLFMVMQLSIAFAIGAAAIYWQWTDNGTLIASLMFIGSFGLTLGLTRLAEWMNGDLQGPGWFTRLRRRRRRLRREIPPDDFL